MPEPNPPSAAALPLPSLQRALLLTDVVDSTQLSVRLGDQAMAEVWAAHDRLARDLLPRWRGREIDKTDGMLLLFDQAADAVQYALAYHRALAGMAQPLRARAGLHVGAVILRENPADDVARGAKPLEVDGLAKPTAARVMSLARGGQTLLTPEAHQALAAALAGGALHSRSHGHWLLKGVAAPVELFEVGSDAAAFAPPPDGDKAHRVVLAGGRWLPVRRIANNLPGQLSSFIGREHELDEIKSLMAGVRLLTLLGMGGLGKTRLSLQAAAELMADYPDGVWFLDLAPLRDAALVAAEAAQVLGLREEPGRPLLQTLCAHLQRQRVLLILDNCEHLLKPAAMLAYAVLKAAPQVAVIASSREALRVPGERCYPILPLPVPGKNDSLAVLAGSTAVRLFVERAQEHRHGFALTAAEAPAVAELVARLEGIPLALELAAARVRSLSVAQINQKLADRYQLLTEGSIVLEERQQTLRALVDWSYDMLDAAEQRVLQRLAVFAGGFDLAAAQPVCGDAAPEGTEVEALLTSLVEKSLLGREQRDGGPRFRLLETLRDYAAEKLAAAGEQPATAARHAEFYFALAKAVKYGLVGPEQARWIRCGEAELDNIRAALALALAGGVDPVIAVKLAVAMQGFWQLRGYATEGRAAVRAALALPAVQASVPAQTFALYVGAALALSQSDHAEASRQLETCLALRRQLGNPTEIAATLSTLCVTRLMGGQVQAAAAGEREALQIFRGLGDRRGEAIGHEHLAQCALYEGDDDQAELHLAQGLALAREINYRENEAACLLMQGELAFERGAPALARDRLEASLQVCQASGNTRGAATALGWLARVELDPPEAGGAGRAAGRLAEALPVFRDFEMREQLLAALETASLALARRGGATLAAALGTAITLSRERLRLPRPPRAERRWQAGQQTLLEQLGEDGADAGMQQGRGWTLDDACREALAALQAQAKAD